MNQGKHWEWLRNAPDWVQGEIAQEFEQLKAQNTKLVQAVNDKDTELFES